MGLINTFNKLHAQSESYQKQFEIYRESLRQYSVIFLYGAGADCIAIANCLGEALKDKEVYFIDKDEKKHGKEILPGIFCYGISKMYGYGKNAIIIITSSAFAKEIFNELNNKKYQAQDKLKSIKIDDTFAVLFVHDKQLQLRYANYDKIFKIFDWFYDEKSCSILYHDFNIFLSWNSFANVNVDDFLPKSESFLPKRIQEILRDDEIIVCCGAFLGYTIEEFNKLKYKKIYAFEINRMYMEQLKEDLNDERITLINAGLGEKNSRASNSDFYNLCSDDFLELKSIDELIENGELDKEISFVKLGIGKLTMLTLKGMQHMIKSNKPTISIGLSTDYKRPEDFMEEIVAFLKSLVPEYKFMLRKHGHIAASMGADLVLYAFVDKEAV